MGCDIHLFVEKKNTENGEWESIDAIDVGRDYDLFGFIAGVRNDQHQYFVRKGFPDDASDDVKKECDDWGIDGHSHSWLTLEELQTVDWDDDKATIKLSGIMDNDQWKKYEQTVKDGKPDYSIITAYWQGGGDPATSSRHEWDYPRKSAFNEFNEGVVKLLRDYCAAYECKPSDIRIVFWFDN